MSQALWVIIPAAGVGQRMQVSQPKQYLLLAGESVLDRTIEIFLTHSSIAGVAVGLGANDAYWPESKWSQDPRVKTFIGGAERSETVKNGLCFLTSIGNNTEDEVLVHDAARPLLTHNSLSHIIQHRTSQGALLAMPAKETVKRQSNNATQVQETLDRNEIWLAQTPQKFVAKTLLEALLQAEKEHVTITDECSAMEHMGYHPDLLMGENSNIKITLPEDLLIAEALLSHLSKTSS